MKREAIRVEWSLLAQADRDAIFDFIEAENPRAAVAVDQRIRGQVEGLQQFPKMGRTGRVEGTRELLIVRTPYIAAYRVVGGTVRILRILHGARRWPEKNSDEL